jgi:hypothetical protein
VETLPLQQNHRSSTQIAAFGTGLRAILESSLPPSQRLQKVRRAINGLPSPEDEIGPDWISRPFGTSAILTRTNGDAIRIMQKLLGKEVLPPAGRLVLKAGAWAPPPPPWVAALLARARSSSVTRSQFDRIHAKVIGELDEEARLTLSFPSSADAWMRLLNASGRAGEEQSLDISALRGRIHWPDAFPDDEQQPENGLYVTTAMWHRRALWTLQFTALPKPSRQSRSCCSATQPP